MLPLYCCFGVCVFDLQTSWEIRENVFLQYSTLYDDSLSPKTSQSRVN